MEGDRQADEGSGGPQEGFRCLSERNGCSAYLQRGR
jgi:serine/threonine protein kinase